jgi:hypothetical protein
VSWGGIREVILGWNKGSILEWNKGSVLGGIREASWSGIREVSWSGLRYYLGGGNVTAQGSCGCLSMGLLSGASV